MGDPYIDREQTQAKHFILKRYLQALAFKVLNFTDLTYVDGFSGPWNSKTEDFSDTSFKIALSVLSDAQHHFQQQKHIRRRIRCFFSEVEKTPYEKLKEVVAGYHRPETGFEIQTFHGKFEDAVHEIQRFIDGSFPLIFIDPTGWSGYPFEKIKPLFDYPRCEVLINFMYDFVNRFVYSEDETIIETLNPILGGPGWRQRLDPTLSRGAAVEKLFRDSLRSAGKFPFVVSTKIDKATADRPHFIIAYATKSAEGLIAFRNIEYPALREHERNRAAAMERKREVQTGIADMFAGTQADVREASIEEIVDELRKHAAEELISILERSGQKKFQSIVADILQTHMLRETNIKDICVTLEKAGVLENTWGARNRKPREDTIIRLKKFPLPPDKLGHPT